MDMILASREETPKGFVKATSLSRQGCSLTDRPEAHNSQCAQVCCPSGVSGRCSPQSPEQILGSFTWLSLSISQPGAKVPAPLGKRGPLAGQELAQCSEHELRKWAGCGLALGGNSEAGWLCWEAESTIGKAAKIVQTSTWGNFSCPQSTF